MDKYLEQLENILDELVSKEDKETVEQFKKRAKERLNEMD